MCPACALRVSVWSWFALQFALQDLETALIATLLRVYTHRLYGTVWYTVLQACVCRCVFGYCMWLQ